MIQISATNLRNNLFTILQKIESGEQVVITHKKKPIARMTPENETDWRDHLPERPQLLVSPDELIKPMEDLWDGYI